MEIITFYYKNGRVFFIVVVLVAMKIQRLKNEKFFEFFGRVF